MAKNSVLTILNRHKLSLGEPPNLKPNRWQYVSYFENQYGDQMVFIHDKPSGRSFLLHGFYGWDRKVEVVDGKVSLDLNHWEREWLMLCWNASRKYTKYK